MTFAVCSVVAGLVLLFLGAEVMIRGGVALSRRLKVSPHVIGLTVIAFGTSAPELFVSMKAALSGAPAIAIGNVVGSNLANILLMIGTVGVIAPIACASPNLRREGAALVAATALFTGASVTGHIGPLLGATMVAALIGYLLLCYRMDLAQGDNSVFAREAAEFDEHSLSLPRATAQTVGGILAVVIGARLLVDGAVVVAAAAGVSHAVIGITLVAFGTSLPELATTLVAALRRHGDVALANIIGSNIFNTIGITGAVAAVTGLPIPPSIVAVELWLMVAVTVAFVAITLTCARIPRPLAVLFFLLYAAIIGAQFLGGAP